LRETSQHQHERVMSASALIVILFALLFLLPIAVAAVRYWLQRDGTGWRTADRSSIGHLPPAHSMPEAMLRVFAARTVRWRGAFATHCWIVFKPENATSYTRYDCTAWGEPIRMNGFEPDGRWFGRAPEVVYAADGPAASAMIPKMQAAIRDYAFRDLGDYRAWPGPNSNTFVAAVLDAVPGIAASLPPTAIGKDYPYDGRWLRRTASGAGFRLTLGGYFGLTLGWVEGIEVNILGAVAGLDLRRPALKLPGLGRLGLAT
jgi:Protein of unknown function (DUF3750)